MKTVLCFGNPDLSEDSLSLEIAKELSIPGFEFIHSTKPDILFNYIGNDSLYIMDMVYGIDKVTLITDLDKLKLEHSVSAHDLDLGFFLKLMQATGKLNTINIIGLPRAREKQEIKAQVRELLTSIHRKI
jgi:Ni,Fe-hydrogenase maturation factor